MLDKSFSSTYTQVRNQGKNLSFQAGPAAEGVKVLSKEVPNLAEKSQNILRKLPIKPGDEGRLPFDQVSGLATAVVSAVGFAVGGVGLMYDYLYKKNHPETESDKKQEQEVKQAASPLKQEVFKELYKKLSKSNPPKEGCKNEEAEGEMGNIEPKTPFGKLGLKFAKVGIGFSGIAGIFNGIAMRVPLMSLGEGANVLSSPIIDKPVGFGLFSVGLATIFAGRALENDPALKINPEILASKKGMDKAKYVMSNMGKCLQEVGNSTKAVFGNLGKLFTGERAEAARFFRNNILAVRPTTVAFEEHLTEAGKTILKKSMKSPPYRMHTASAILALGGMILSAASLVKNKLGQKIGFTTCEVGGSLDNLSLSYSGLEKLTTGVGALNKSAGTSLALSGATILAGQPNVDKDHGRALQWLGCALLFTTFAFERSKGLKDALKEISYIKKAGVKEEATRLIRTWEVDLTRGLKKKDFANGNLNRIIKTVNGTATKEETAKLPGKLKELFKFADDAIQGKDYIPELARNSSTGKMQAITSSMTDKISTGMKKLGFIVKKGSEGDKKEILQSVISENKRVFLPNT